MTMLAPSVINGTAQGTGGSSQQLRQLTVRLLQESMKAEDTIGARGNTNKNPLTAFTIVHRLRIWPN
jgi:hypothetical protein